LFGVQFAMPLVGGVMPPFVGVEPGGGQFADAAVLP